jgi:hypothetical protein
MASNAAPLGKLRWRPQWLSGAQQQWFTMRDVSAEIKNGAPGDVTQSDAGNNGVGFVRGHLPVNRGVALGDRLAVSIDDLGEFAPSFRQLRAEL